MLSWINEYVALIWLWGRGERVILGRGTLLSANVAATRPNNPILPRTGSRFAWTVRLFWHPLHLLCRKSCAAATSQRSLPHHMAMRSFVYGYMWLFIGKARL